MVTAINTTETTDYRVVEFTHQEIAALERSAESAYWGDMSKHQWDEFIHWMKSKPKPELMEIVVFKEGAKWFILDGYHRWKGAMELGITQMLTFKQYLGTERPLLGMILNANRRQLTSSRRAMLVQQVKEKEGMSNDAAAAAAKVSVRQIQRANTAAKAGLSGFVLDGPMTLEDATDIAKDKTLLKAVKSGATPVATAVQQVQDSRHKKRADSSKKLAERYGIKNGQDSAPPGESASRDDFEQLLGSSKQLTAKNQVLREEVKSLEERRNDLMVQFSERADQLQKQGIPLAEVVSAPMPAATPAPVPASGKADSHKVSPAMEAARKAAGYDDMSTSEKRAWTRIYGQNNA